ncbi:Cache, type 2 domain protein [Magnetococcus marinus MC-1]|uniref:Cache, type 2 domain protein n=1 Tax=Magnetococcus marinus (strain ATCC BAA-1437 / JCM 17883 / MC-1) TaxID=156889 RepID=A0L858_MAGMM|nr:cache domain-containing protein [Magnetococcus marinus]ABK44151.1 Cache, type 2 domain protein [Magnetococcus marinus MC-1]
MAVLAITTTLTFAAQAEEMATPMEAKELTNKAMELVATQGRETAFKTFADAAGDFQPKDLYMFCLDMQGVMIFHAKKPQLVGKNLLAFNKYGDMLFTDMTNLAKSEGEGWVNYHWPYPGSEEIKEKASYIKSASDHSFYCGSGAYK